MDIRRFFMGGGRVIIIAIALHTRAKSYRNRKVSNETFAMAPLRLSFCFVRSLQSNLHAHGTAQIASGVIHRLVVRVALLNRAVNQIFHVLTTAVTA